METKFKPFMPIKSITFDTLGQDIDSHPVIIIHNMDGLELFYIKSRTAIDENGQLKKPTEGEILIKKSKNRNALFKNDSYLDCSQLFRIQELDYDDLIHNNKKLQFTKTTQLSYEDVLRIFDKIDELIKKIPPYIALSDVSYDRNTNKIQSDLLYASNKHLDGDLKYLLDNNKLSSSEIQTWTNYVENIKNSKNLEGIDIVSKALKKAKRDYNGEMVIEPLARWIEDNKLIEKGKTTKDIILEHNSLFNQGKKIAARPIGIYDVGVINYFAFADCKIKKNDLKFAHDEFDKISILGLDFEQFKSMHTNRDGQPLFNFNWLEQEFELFMEKEELYNKYVEELKAKSKTRKMKM
ncbi:Mbov_0400 family ICE element protein [Mesomycoplasma conjunctivae]|uniref:Mbov_0400 family ICE element protein n=1 Tax=Mesomycoplasma conjunctivae TaxID=45361 RepID=UPI003DA28EF6